MNLIIGVRFLLKDPNEHRQVMRINAHLLWENFLSNLVYTYKTKVRQGRKTEINVYVCKYQENKRIYHLFEYVVPMKLVDYYGREKFKSVLPKGSMLDLIESK